MPRKPKYDPAEIEKRYVDLGQAPATIAAHFAPPEKDKPAYLKALKRVRAVIRAKGWEQIAQGVRAVEPEVKAQVQDKREQLLKAATAEYVWCMTQIQQLRTNLVTPGEDGKTKPITPADLHEQLDLLEKCIKGLERIGLGLAPPPITPVLNLGMNGAGILADAADKHPGSNAERERLVVLYERLRDLPKSGPPPGVVIEDDDDDDEE